MIRNYFSIAWRNLLRNKSYAFINISGLVLGLTMAIVLFWIVRFERSFDTYHSKASRIYQLFTVNKQGERNSHVPQAAIPLLRDQTPEVELVGVVWNTPPKVVSAGDKQFQEPKTFYAHQSVFKMIDVQWISGSPEVSLSKPYQAVLSESTAKRLFNGDAMGKTLRMNNHYDAVVSGIIKDVPANSEFQFHIVISYETVKAVGEWVADETYWGGGDSAYHMYVLLRDGSKPDGVVAKLDAAIAPFREELSDAHFGIAPLTAAHFDADNDTFAYFTPLRVVNVLTGIGLFLVIIACINFINLATVQSILRGREIAVRKMLGSRRTSLVLQFLTETTVTVFIAIAVASVAATFLIRYSDQFLSTGAAAGTIWDAATFGFLAILTVSVVVLSGLYPAFILSGFAPVKIFRNRLSLSNDGSTVRQSLVVLQFVIAQVMVIAMLVGGRQVSYFYSTDPGYQQTSIVSVPIADMRDKHVHERFRRALLQLPAVQAVTFGLETPSSHKNRWWGTIHYPGLPEGEGVFRKQWVDANYFDLFRIPLVAGRMFIETDSVKGRSVCMVNRLATRSMGFKEPAAAIGAVLEEGSRKFEIIGVVEDYHSEGLKEIMRPHMFFFQSWNFQTAIVHIDGKDLQSTVEQIGQVWMKEFPSYYFEYTHMDNIVKRFYDDEKRFSNFVNVFAAVGIAIGCLGLYGLVSFFCMRKTKEIGIRKVLGASMAGIVATLSSVFVKLVLISFVIAAPVGWWLMKEFLSQYAYPVDMTWYIFAFAGAISLVVAMVPIAYRSVKAVTANPIDSLRTE